jgi:hypothetical protein
MNDGTTLNLPFPNEKALHLHLTLGACRIRIRPGTGAEWVAGTYSDPTGSLPLRVSRDGGTLRISQEFHWSEALGSVREPPTFDVALGTARPFRLTMEGGASESLADLGALPLLALDVRYGAGRQLFDFSAPNPQPMDTITIAAGAASVEMTRLANANFAHMALDGGAARFVLDFGGALARDGDVKINTGMASVELTVPSTTAAIINAETVMGGVEVGEGWMKREGAFRNPAALAGGGPAITVRAHVVMGGLRLESRAPFAEIPVQRSGAMEHGLEHPVNEDGRVAEPW